ncbi:MAG TPA: protein translocase subunit SecD, partial [Dehalococcoidales bacterium]|nr:protein translocase subunit SecD [Dehalococcoidales bacterium]
MTRRNGIFLVLVLGVLALLLWLIFPLQGVRLGRKGINLGLDLQGGLHLEYKADLSKIATADVNPTMQDIIKVIEARVNPLGVSEPTIQRKGADGIVVELPGVSVTDQEKENIGSTTLLVFGKQQTTTNSDGTTSTTWVPATATINGVVETLDSSYFKNNTQVTTSSTGQVILVFNWTTDGSAISKAVTTELLNKPLGIFQDSVDAAGNNLLKDDTGKAITPTVNAVITDSGEIEGLSVKTAQTLSAQLNAGRLPVPLTIVSEQNLTPEMGADFVHKSVEAAIIALAIIMVFMIAYYRVLGVVASIALVYYAAIVLAVFKILGVTLSIASFGGFILSLGVAVDANVLIFERMKEEMRGGRQLGEAVEAGFHRAWPAIRDSNFTTLIAGIVLFWLGSVTVNTSVKGFALTLVIGIIASMLTAITISRVFVRPLAGTGLGKNKGLFTPHQGKPKSDAKLLAKPYDIINNRLWYFFGSAIVILAGIVGIFVFGIKPGIEFESGSQVTLNVNATVSVSDVNQALSSLGYNDVIVQGTQGTGASNFLVSLPTAINDTQKAALTTGLTDKLGTVTISNPEIVYRDSALATSRNAIIAVIVAALAMILYIAWAFHRMPNPFRWGFTAIVAVIHDILVVVGTFAIVGGILGWRFDLMSITAILTVFHYSVNDTVIIYDRIRENMRWGSTGQFGPVVNHSLIVTLARSLNTSLTALLSAFVLLIFVGGPIRDFALILIIGI